MSWTNERVEVIIRETGRRTIGTIVRDDADCTIIRLDEGRYLLSTECQYRRTNPVQMWEEGLPLPLLERVRDWLKADEKTLDQVAWGRFPIGMVLRWIERAEEAERQLGVFNVVREAADGTREVARRELAGERITGDLD